MEEARALQAVEQEELGHNPRGGMAAKVLVSRRLQLPSCPAHAKRCSCLVAGLLGSGCTGCHLCWPAVAAGADWLASCGAGENWLAGAVA